MPVGGPCNTIRDDNSSLTIPERILNVRSRSLHSPPSSTGQTPSLVYRGRVWANGCSSATQRMQRLFIIVVSQSSVKFGKKCVFLIGTTNFMTNTAEVATSKFLHPLVHDLFSELIFIIYICHTYILSLPLSSAIAMNTTIIYGSTGFYEILWICTNGNRSIVHS